MTVTCTEDIALFALHILQSSYLDSVRRRFPENNTISHYVMNVMKRIIGLILEKKNGIFAYSVMKISFSRPKLFEYYAMEKLNRISIVRKNCQNFYTIASKLSYPLRRTASLKTKLKQTYG